MACAPLQLVAAAKWSSGARALIKATQELEEQPINAAE